MVRNRFGLLVVIGVLVLGVFWWDREFYPAFNPINPRAPGGPTVPVVAGWVEQLRERKIRRRYGRQLALELEEELAAVASLSENARTMVVVYQNTEKQVARGEFTTKEDGEIVDVTLYRDDTDGTFPLAVGCRFLASGTSLLVESQIQGGPDQEWGLHFVEDYFIASANVEGAYFQFRDEAQGALIFYCFDGFVRNQRKEKGRHSDPRDHPDFPSVGQ